MNIKDNLRQTIDRLVEDSIRRILPTVMNEVLVRTLLSSGGLAETVTESRDRPRRRKKVRQRVQPRERVQPKARPARVKQNEALSRREQNLRDLLDDSAGADFYADPRAVVREEAYEEPQRPAVTAARLASLPPELQSLAQDVQLPEDDDGGGTWDEMNESIDQPVARAIPDIDRAAAKVGIDFSRMAGTIKMTEKAPKVSVDDARAREQFEARRIKAMRESLNGGKPVE